MKSIILLPFVIIIISILFADHEDSMIKFIKNVLIIIILGVVLKFSLFAIALLYRVFYDIFM